MNELSMIAFSCTNTSTLELYWARSALLTIVNKFNFWF